MKKNKNQKRVKGAASFIGGCAIGYLGGFDHLLKLYIMLVCVDYISGLLKGIKTKKLSSAVAFWGCVNKIIAFSLVAVCVELDRTIGIDMLRDISLIWFSLSEGVSILENAVILGNRKLEGLAAVLVQAEKGFSINVSKIVQKMIEDWGTSKKK